MTTAVAILASLGFIAWLIYRGVAKKPVKAHNIAYGISVISGLTTYAFFLGMNIEQLIKVVLSIFIGVILLFVAAYFQRRRTVNN